MTAIDWLLLAAYLVLTLVLGLWLAAATAARRIISWQADV